MEEYTYKCVVSDNMIKIRYNEDINIVHIEAYNIDNSMSKMFLILFRQFMDDIIESGYEYISINVHKDEIDIIKNNDKWEIIKEEETTTIVKCEIKNSIECIIEPLIKIYD